VKPAAVRSAACLTLWVSHTAAEPRLKEGWAELRFGQEPGDYYITQNRSLVVVRLRSARQAYDLDFHLGSGRARLVTVDQVSKDGSAAQITIRCFNGELFEIGDVEIGLDDRFVENATRLFKTGKQSVAEIGKLLAELCTLRLGPDPDDCFFLLTAGAAAEADFVDTEGSLGQLGQPATNQVVAAAERAFCIHGDGIRIAIARKRVSADDDKYLAMSVTNALGGDPDGAMRLAHGRLRFADFSRTGRIQALAAGALLQLREREQGYLKQWDQYGAIEGEMLLERARRIGMLSWQSAEQLPRGGTGVRFFFPRPLPLGLVQGDELEFAQEIPVYLINPAMTWAEYSAVLEGELEQPKEASRGRSSSPRPEEGEPEDVNPGVVAKVTEVSETSLVLDLQIAPDRKDIFLIQSLSGERAQIRRRMEARRLILEGRSANPMLGLLIEEHGLPPVPVRGSRIEPLSAFVRRKVFSHGPTATQEEAIRIALNTPDIALIQGPPGTGKTTVIAAIVERLNELSDKKQSFQGEVLISAFQHDAIENMMARLTVNSLPVPKFGRRSGTVEIGDRSTEQIRRWCANLAAKLRERNHSLRTSEKLRDAQLRCHEYVLAPSLDNAIGTIDALLNVEDVHLPDEFVVRASALKKLLQHERGSRPVQADHDLLRALWALRTSVEGFLDDGPATALSLLQLCATDLPTPARELLAQAGAWLSSEPPPFLPALRRVKSELLEWYQPRAVFQIDKPRQDVLQLVSDAARHILPRVTRGTDRTDSILAEFLHELESNPEATQRAIEEYGFVFAATCQQTRGKAIVKRKSKSAETRAAMPDYDTVIIDEAARSSPRDLLIPMAQARKRIILVGDHRQLPHLIDEEIARSLETESDSTAGQAADRESNYIRRSMFQYLLSRLKQLQARDGIKRWVTLDQQFRMHPLLGKFVSDYFYRKHDPKEAFESPLPAELFAHGLPDIAAVPAVWIDVPARIGEAERAGTSRFRAPEAWQIARWIERWIDSPAGRKLTFGIISFYKAQEAQLYEALSAHGYTTRGPDEKWRVADSYALRPPEEGLPKEERLRIGTVDAFQGMEFDVVFLSMVRSQPRLDAPNANQALRAQQEQATYGHLISANRLCVSMSRQRRLLVVVGDRAMVEHDLARNAIPGLVGFLDLCRTHGVVLRARG
jgi:hypothetical protein